MSTFTRMGVYLKVIDQSEYFPVEPDVSDFAIISVAKLKKGEVGVPITFTTNNLTTITDIIGLPVYNRETRDTAGDIEYTSDERSNNKEWWAMYRGFNYSSPISVFRVVNDLFRNPAGKLTVDESGSKSVIYTGVDGTEVSYTTTGKVDATEDQTIKVENSEISEIRMDNVLLGSNEVGVGVYKYLGINDEDIKFVVINKAGLEDTVTIDNIVYDAAIQATFTYGTDGSVESISIEEPGEGYNDSTVTLEIVDEVTGGTGFDYTINYDLNGGVDSVTINDGGSGYSSLKFQVTEDDTTQLKYNEYSSLADLYDFDLEDNQNILAVFVDGSIIEYFLFDGDSNSDDYWGNIESNYGYFKFNDDILNGTNWQETAYAQEFTFEGKGVGEMSDVEYDDYLTTLDYIVENPIDNAIIIDGAIPSLFSTNQTKVFQQKMISTVAPAMNGFAVLSFPKSIEDTFIGKFKVEEDDLDSTYISYKNSLGYNSGELGYNGAIFGPSQQRVFDVFNNQYIWIPISVDIAGAMTRLGQNFQYSPVAINRGQVGFDRLNWNLKNETLEGYLYKNGVNPIFNSNGSFIIKGHKTLTTKNTAFNRINVSRTMSVFKVVAKALGQQFVGELALPETRLSVTEVYSNFISTWIGLNRIVDAKIVCDSTNNSDTDIDNNLLNIDIYVKPVKVYDYINITITVLPQSVEIN